MYVFVLSSSINGLCHHAGYRNFDNTATNIRVLALVTGGEGLHNNHHGYPRSPKFSLRDSEIDPAWPIIKLLTALGLAKPVQDDRRSRGVVTDATGRPCVGAAGGGVSGWEDRLRPRRSRPRPPVGRVARPFRRERAPVLHDLRRVAVNLEPHQRVAENAAVHERPLGAGVGADVAEAALQAQNLPQPLDVAAGERQLAELDPRRTLGFGGPMDARRDERNAERHEQRAEQDRVGQRLRR